MNMERVHLVVRGRVQGVYYRASTRDRARRWQLHGWVRNCTDGSVEIVAEGEKETLEQLIAWCHTGPPGAMVTAVDVEWQAATGEFSGFMVKN
jgi:acylphosphatase